MSAQKVIALSGGVGGAKLVLGLSKVLAPDALTIIGNTGDDFQHFGLPICPDLDTVLYTLADWNNKELGWGQVNESWNFLEGVKRLGGESWFNLGDRDMATHVVRSEMLKSGMSLSAVVSHLARKMGVTHSVVPMSDDTVSTMVHTQGGETLTFQHYFVRDRCEPEVTGFEFAGIETAVPSAGFASALKNKPDVVIICPSNPFVSVAPILAIPGVQDALRESDVSVVVVSNIVGGQAVKGPAAKMMQELGMPQTALGVAEHYRSEYGDLITGFVLDSADLQLEEAVQALGFETFVTNTMMVDVDVKVALAEEVLSFAQQLVRT